MKTIIAGTRTIGNKDLIERSVLLSNFEITEVVCGTASGVDILGKLWALENNINVVDFPAEWDKYGKKAGPIRNKQMSEYADALIAIWDGKSSGTRNMINNAKRDGLKVYVYNLLEIRRQLYNKNSNEQSLRDLGFE